jgi:hypothetical protein
MTLSDSRDLLDGIPDYREYMNVDELNSSSEKLARDHPSTVKMLDLGKSSKGEPIRCLKMGEGKHSALIYGFPNPEEPVGGLAIDYLSRSLAENKSLLREIDYTWYFIKCIDPDGARLNVGFLKGPLTPMNFSKNYYRTSDSLSGEENFPFRYGAIDFNRPLPETKALMKILDETSFDFISGLHNMKWGGVTYQVSEPCSYLYGPFQEMAKGYDVMPRKMPGTMLAPGIQLAQYFTPVRNYVRAKTAGKSPLEEITGAYTFEYAQLSNPHVFMMIPECALWYDVRCWDDRPSDSPFTDVLTYRSQVGTEANKFMLSIFQRAEPLLKHPSPFFEMIRPLIREIRSPTVNVSDPDPDLSKQRIDRPATIAEKVEIEGRADVYRLFNLGAMIRLLDDQLAQSATGKSTLESCRAETVSKLEAWGKELDRKYECSHHPIRNLVGVCLGSILYSMEYVKWNTWVRTR